MKTKTAFVLLLVFGELIILTYLGLKIYKNRSTILGTLSVNPVSKDSLQINTDTTLKYFYEPASNIKDPYTINSDTLNERFDYEAEKPKNTYRIITLGDSFTFGQNVQTKYNWSEQLEDLLNSKLICHNYKKFEVINLGVMGYDIRYAFERFKIRGQKYQPDLVVWLVKDDDLIQINEVMLPKEKYWEKKLKETGELEKEIASGNFYPSYSRALWETYNELGEERILTLQQQFLGDFRKIYKNSLIITALSLNDNYQEFVRNYTEKYPDAFFFNRLDKIINESETSFAKDGHPNEKGHRLIAEDLSEYIISSNIIPCN